MLGDFQMALKDPIAAYNAANNVEADMLRSLLIDRGIGAHVTEDNSPAGIFDFGPLAEIHKLQVWIERSDAERVKPILDEFEQSLRRHRAAAGTTIDIPVEMTCESCGQRVSFPADQRGTVQECPHCNAYLDVGGDDGEWDDMPAEEEADEE